MIVQVFGDLVELTGAGAVFSVGQTKFNNF